MKTDAHPMTLEENRAYRLKTEPGLITAVYRDKFFLALHDTPNGIGIDLIPEWIAKPVEAFPASIIPPHIPYANPV